MEPSTSERFQRAPRNAGALNEGLASVRAMLDGLTRPGA